jgi:biopolymer transport protein ExbB/TolQ
MELAKQIDVAPKNGDFIIMQDACSSELGRWAQEANGWVQADGALVRISRWTWFPDDVSDATDHEHLLLLSSPLPDGETEQTPKRPLARLILAFVIAIFCIGGFVFWIAFEDSSSDDSAAGLALESTRIANFEQRELKQSLDESEARSKALARELASARKSDVAACHLAAARQRENAAQALEIKQIADSRQTELKQTLDESEKKALPLNRELTSARETIASAEKPSSEAVIARDAAAPTGPLDRPMEQSNASSEITSSMTTLQSRGNVTAGVQASSDAIPDDAAAGASGRLTRSTRSESSRPPTPSAMSSAEVKLHFPWSIGRDLRADSTDILA